MKNKDLSFKNKDLFGVLLAILQNSLVYFLTFADKNNVSKR
jgi:hypothetical protein